MKLEWISEWLIELFPILELFPIFWSEIYLDSHSFVIFERVHGHLYSSRWEYHTFEARVRWSLSYPFGDFYYHRSDWGWAPLYEVSPTLTETGGNTWFLDNIHTPLYNLELRMMELDHLLNSYWNVPRDGDRYRLKRRYQSFIREHQYWWRGPNSMYYGQEFYPRYIRSPLLNRDVIRLEMMYQEFFERDYKVLKQRETDLRILYYQNSYNLEIARNRIGDLIGRL